MYWLLAQWLSVLLPRLVRWDSRGVSLSRGPLHRSKMKILITGGAGFIGSSIAESYIFAGHEVGVVDDLSAGKRENLPASARFFFGDIGDNAFLENVFEEMRPDVVSHHAAQMDIRRSLREPQFDANINIIGSLSVLERCVRFGVEKLIFASSGGAIYGEPGTLPATEATAGMPISHYGVSKLAVERYLHAYHRLYGLRYCALRYANVYGPRQNPHGEAGVVAIFAGQMLRGETCTIFGDGSKTRDYIFIEDVVRANLLALNRGECQVFNIGRGIQVSDAEMFETIRRAVGIANQPRFAPHRRGEVQHICLDSSSASRVFGWEPEVGLSEGIGKTIAHIRSEFRGDATMKSLAGLEASQPLFQGRTP